MIQELEENILFSYFLKLYNNYNYIWGHQVVTC